MKELAKKLNNFRLSAFIEAIIQVFGALVLLGDVVCYTFAGGVSDSKFPIQAFQYDPESPVPQMLGMVFFMSCLIGIIVSVVVIYQLLPNILNKEKVSPKKGFLITGAVNSIFHIILIVLSIVLIVREQPQTTAGLIVTIVGSGLYIIANVLKIYPLVRCEYYQPEIKRD